jgi:hypothetical protein
MRLLALCDCSPSQNDCGLASSSSTSSAPFTMLATSPVGRQQPRQAAEAAGRVPDGAPSPSAGPGRPRANVCFETDVRKNGLPGPTCDHQLCSPVAICMPAWITA